MPTPASERREAPSNAFVAAACVAALLFAYEMRYALLPLVGSAALAYVLRPLVDLMRNRLRLPKLAAVLIVYLGVLALFGLAIWWSVTAIGDRLVKDLSDLPALISGGVQRTLGSEFRILGHTIDADTASRRVLDALRAWVVQPTAVIVAGSAIVAAPATAILMFVVLFYFLNSGRRLVEGVLWLAPPRYRENLQDLVRRIDPVLRHYVVGVVLVVIYTAAVAWLGLMFAFHLPYALPISLAVGVLELVPVLGPAASMAIFGLAAFLRGDGLLSFVALMGFAIGLRVSIDELVGPLVLGRAVTLHPVVIIFAFLTGATLFGVLGVLLAVPVAASIKIVLGMWYGEPHDSGRSDAEVPEPPPRSA